MYLRFVDAIGLATFQCTLCSTEVIFYVPDGQVISNEIFLLKHSEVLNWN